MALNVNRQVLDPFYRYKMPRLMAKVEGKGNGIKTVIANMVEIAKSLERPPTYPTKYFGCELGAQTNIDTKNDRYIVNGEHDANKLQDILDGFIRKFVLCTACDNPETTLTVKRNVIHSKCKACGHSGTIDSKHKLSAFIIKNPPKSEKKHKGNSKSDENGNENDHFENGSSDDVEEDWEPEPFDNDEKVSAQIGKLIISKDLDKPIEERLDMLHQYFLNAKKEGRLSDSKELANEAERLDLKTKAPLLLADVIFDENVLEQLKTHRILLLRFTANDQKAQKYLLGGIEQLIANNKDALLPKTAHIIKALYDLDIVTEEVIVAWGEKPSSKYVKKELSRQIIDKAAVIINWLKEADEESEEEDESDDEVGFDERARTFGTVVEKVNTEKAETKEEAAKVTIKGDDGEELDIDDI
ncbi:hypothetical protein QR680_003909 [Steinernema hermaphroditum]|uniref:Eukaryotic translation initiation factor 5 n=1 Tax=Steinernema hermaphroditum TaxID=289476 RepID=A0AA39LST8_9BILA|nr:hypothetical protein QR680_003909 [Steinernema hermaphroditum]